MAERGIEVRNKLQFDLFGAIDAGRKGMQRVAENNAEFLEAARATAREICELRGTVTADDVRARCPVVPSHFNAWGAVFKNPAFVWTGDYQRSANVLGHGNLQRIWRLKT